MNVTDAIRATVLVLVVSAPAFSQPLAPPYAATVDLAGPRFGATFLSDGVVRKLETSSGHLASRILDVSIALNP